jgi:hypothetical protein
MGRASRRRKNRQKRYTIALSYRDPGHLEEQWETLLDVWLSEIRKLAAQWRNGEDTKKSVFEILDEAMSTIHACESSVAKRLAHYTYNVLAHECSMAVAWVVDGRLCRLSNMYTFPELKRKTGKEENK